MLKSTQLEQLESRRLLALNYDYISDVVPSVANNGWGPAELDLSNGESETADGRQIKINGQRYTKGVGMHSHGELRFELNGRYRNFISDVGIDDEAGRGGSVVFQIFADGEKMFDSNVMTGMDSAKRVNIDVTGKREMILILNDAGDGDLMDHGDWAGARLIRPAGPAPSIVKMADIEVRESFPMLSLGGLFNDVSEGPWIGTVDYGDGSGRQQINLGEDKSFALEHVYDASFDSDHTVTVRVSNSFATAVSKFRVAVRNEQPANVGLVGGDSDGTLNAIAGYAVDLNGVFTDPGTFGGTRYNATIDFGDGSPVGVAGVDGRFFNTRHVYRKPGTYTITSTITDSGGKSGVGLNTIVVREPNNTYLSDLTPTNGGTFTSDRAADGSNMKINGAKYSRGIGVFADSNLTFGLGGEYRSLIADVGIDDKVGVNGSVVFQVFGDGQLLFETTPMTGRDGARRMNIDVRGISEIQLVATHSGEGAANTLDRANWAGIRAVS